LPCLAEELIFRCMDSFEKGLLLVLNRKFLIVPVLFLPLIENAFKHTSTREGKNIIQTEITIEGNLLTFRISNPRQWMLRKKFLRGAVLVFAMS
jgi:hypothetical protein